MTWLSERTERRRHARASALLGWAFALVALLMCCSLDAEHPAPTTEHGRFAPASVWAVPPVHGDAVDIVVIDAPRERGPGSSCSGTAEHSAPVVLPVQPSPVALPTAAVPLVPAPLTGASAIRGPSNDAVGDVDRFSLQVQRI
ncbi:hypothetical protein [Streptomyces sp. NPDC059783]|uniref:hypothetical protein n=1 Tax=Streptomyces sp. NPDC059783 TaxID=3346944 RepID=UPI0036622DD8